MPEHVSSVSYSLQASNGTGFAGSVCSTMKQEEIQDFRRERLRAAIEHLCNGNESEFGRRLGYKDGAFVRQMLSGMKAISEKTVIKIEELPGMAGWFSKKDEQPPENVAGGLRRVPVISWVQAGAMTPVTDIYAPGYAEEWVETPVPAKRHTYALRVRGDSMEPTFPDGHIIIVDPDLDPMPGDYVIARNGDGEATFKQLIKDGSDWYLKPVNPRYPVKPLGEATIIGVVRAVEKRFR